MLSLWAQNQVPHHSIAPTVATSAPTAFTWPPQPPPPTTSTFQPDRTSMLGLHNIFLIAPPPSSYHLHQPPPIPPTDQTANTINEHYNIPNHQEPWTTLRKYQQESSFGKKSALNVGEGDHATDNSSRVCRDCGNRAKKECEFRRCRTCCKTRGYDCATHVKSTWAPAARKRTRIGGDGGSSNSSSGVGGGGKRQRENATTTSNSFSTSNNNAAGCFTFDTGSSYQDARFKQSLPGKVRAAAIFRCIRVTAISGGEAEVAYQAMVNISGHVFRGFLYDQGKDEKNLFPCISKMHSSERNTGSTSPMVDPSSTLAASSNKRLLEGTA